MKAPILLFLFTTCVVAAGPIQEKPAPKPKPSAAQAKAEENYAKTCLACHGPEGKAPLPDMNLADGQWKHGSTLAAITKTIAEGVPGTAMLPNKDKLSKAEIAELAKLVRSFDSSLNTKKPPAKK
jgi:mono/diheme cytochrome c family protein